VASVWAQKRKTKDGRLRYTGVYRTNDGRQVCVGTFDTEEEAKRTASLALQEKEGVIPAGELSHDKIAKITLAEFADIFLRRIKHRTSPSTVRQYTFLLKNYVIPALGKRRMRNIRPLDLSYLINSIEAKHSPVYARTVRAMLSAMFREASLFEIVTSNPASGIRTGKIPIKPITVFTPEKFNRFLTYLPNDVSRTFALFAINTGARISEICAARVSDLNLEKGVWNVTKALKRTIPSKDNGWVRYVIGPTKTYRYRQIHLGAKCLERIKTHIEENNLGPNDILFPARLFNIRSYMTNIEIDEEEVRARGPVITKSGRVYWHGNYLTYYHPEIKCRCDLCMAAKRKYERALRRRKSTKEEIPPPEDFEYLTPDQWGRIHRRAMKAMIEAGEARTPVLARNLRHTHATHLYMKGVPTKLITDRMGHGPDVLVRHYVSTDNETFGNMIARYIDDFEGAIDFDN